MLEKRCHVHDQVADHGEARQRREHDRLADLVEAGDAGERVAAVDVHRVGAAHALAA